MIKAPYNFVPLAQNVVFPEWASQISIDRPFEDGISGTIEVKYVAQTPVFIGNGKDDDKPIKSYQAANGKYAIPGSTLRGMLRNVIEIVSFSKFNRVSNATLSLRDLTAGGKEIYRKEFSKNQVNGGWLIFENGRWVVYPVKYHRIKDDKIEKYYQLNHGELKTREESEKRIKRLKASVKVYFSQDNRMVSINKTQVGNVGFIVLTGHPGGNKRSDFIFENKKSANSKVVAYETILEFNQANAPKASDQKSGFDLVGKLSRCKKMGYPGIPVFYISNTDGTPKSLGLSMMYRLPYKKTLHDAINNSCNKNFFDNMDFAECIFGKIEDTKNKNHASINFSLRSRVQFEDAITESEPDGNQINTILNNPKPTYYPNYIEQSGRKYSTLMDPNVKLRGWKRYPVRNQINPIEGTGETSSCFRPLKECTIFNGRIHFHNLKREELGALLWAITWGNDENLSHAVGMGKPYGFGQIKAEISSVEYLPNNDDSIEYKFASKEDLNDWMKSFTGYMEDKIRHWSSQKQLEELKAMANPKKAERKNWDLSYMSLDKKEFVYAKNEKIFLSPYSADNQVSRLERAHNNPKKAGAHQSTSTSHQGKPGDEIQLKVVVRKGNKSSFKYPKE